MEQSGGDAGSRNWVQLSAKVEAGGWVCGEEQGRGREGKRRRSGGSVVHAAGELGKEVGNWVTAAYSGEDEMEERWVLGKVVAAQGERGSGG